jgi:uncharacterized RDD family membrane protein YckC
MLDPESIRQHIGPTSSERPEEILSQFADIHEQLSPVEASDFDTTDKIETPYVPSFDEIDLTRISDSKTTEESPESGHTETADELSPEDYLMPLGQLLDRQKQQDRHRAPLSRAFSSSTDRTILVSRFLAGLIDFVIILSLAVATLALTAYFTGAEVLQPLMGWLLGGMVVLFSYAYGFFYLFLNGRTLGMMLVGLQLKSGETDRLSVKQSLLRITVYLIGVTCAGAGLVWALFNSEAKCWHDLVSDSTVIRIA